MAEMHSQRRYHVTYRDGIGNTITANLEYVGQGWWAVEGESWDDRLIIEVFLGPDGHVTIPDRMLISAEPA